MTPSALRRDRGRAADRHGRCAEVLCALRLWLMGWSVVERRYGGGRGTGRGEIDIIARRGRVVAFIEVKARRSAEEALDSLGDAQRRRLNRAVADYLARHPEHGDADIRFDIMIVAGGVWPARLTDAWRP